MNDDGAELVLLVEELDVVELSGLRALLDGHDVEYVVQGEMHSAMVGGLTGNPAITPRVLVAKRDLEKARALLAADAQAETVPAAGASLEGALCPVHEKPALSTCARCGTFLCADCKALGDPPMCEDCLAGEDDARAAKKADPARRSKSAVVFFVVLAAVMIAIIARNWL